jgi:hypothetical protein
MEEKSMNPNGKMGNWRDASDDLEEQEGGRRVHHVEPPRQSISPAAAERLRDWLNHLQDWLNHLEEGAA